ncbi:MAG: GntR family transcriptional regulator [Rhodospirillaceae bacterium]
MNKISAIKHAVDDGLAVPLYHQVYLILKENVRSGTYSTGTALPTEQALCKEFRVSRITVKRAMRELVADGFVVRHRGKGTFVAEGVAAPSSDAMTDLLKSVEAIGAATDVRHLSSDLMTPPTDVAEKLKLEAGAMVLKSSQIRLSDGEPLSLIVTYVPQIIAEQLDAGSENLPMLVQLNKAGVPVARAEQEVTATLAEPAVAVPLGIEVGAPLLKLTRLILDDAGQPVEWLTSLYRGDRYAMRTSLTHETSGRTSGWKTAAE